MSRLHLLDHVITDIIIEFREHFGADKITQRGDHITALVRRGQLDQVGNVRGVERGDEFARAFAIARLHRVTHGGDICGLQPIVLVMPGFLGGDGLFHEAAVVSGMVGARGRSVGPVHQRLLRLPDHPSSGCFRAWPGQLQGDLPFPARATHYMGRT